MAVTSIWPVKSRLDHVINYARNPEKTRERSLVSQGLIMTSSTKTFSDVADGKWYSSYIRQAVQYGLISGYTDGTFRPEQYITRAETVTMINRMLGRNYETAYELHSMACPFPDVSQSSWAYGNIMEAAITHKH